MATLSCTITFVVLISSLVLPLISPTNAQQCTPYSCPLIPSPYTKPGANYILRIGLIESDYTQNNTLSLTRYVKYIFYFIFTFTLKSINLKQTYHHLTYLTGMQQS